MATEMLAQNVPSPEILADRWEGLMEEGPHMDACYGRLHDLLDELWVGMTRMPHVKGEDFPDEFWGAFADIEKAMKETMTRAAVEWLTSRPESEA